MQPVTWRAWRARCGAPGLSTATAAPSPAQSLQPTWPYARGKTTRTFLNRGQFNLGTQGDTTEDQRWFSLYHHCSQAAALLLALAMVKVQQHWFPPDQVVQACQGGWIYIQTPARTSGDVTLFGRLSELGCGRHWVPNLCALQQQG